MQSKWQRKPGILLTAINSRKLLYSPLTSIKMEMSSSLVAVSSSGISALLAGRYFVYNSELFFALIPPARICGGWLAFFVSLCFIGFITAVVAEFASLFGCVIGLEPEVTAITFVALGTSLPDTFASMQAA